MGWQVLTAGWQLLSAVPIDVDVPPGASTADLLWLVLFAAGAIGISFFCSVVEAVLLSVTPSYIAALKEQGKRSADALQQLKEGIDRPLSAILSLNTIAHTAGAAGVGAQAASLWGSQAVGWASAAMTLLILVLSEIIPKTIGAVYWRVLAPWTAAALRVLIIAMYPLVLLSDVLTHLIAGDKPSEVVTREEVVAMAALSAQGGQLELKESQILRNLFLLHSLKAYDIMTPRPVIVAFPDETTVGWLQEHGSHLPVSRIPIFKGTIDHVTGFVLKNDILLAQANDKPQTPLHTLQRPLRAVPGSASLSQLLDVLLGEREHIALVVDEYGGTDGLVTMEDLIETLLGIEIIDEADTTANMQRLARQRWEQRAKALGLELEPYSPAGSPPWPPNESNHPSNSPETQLPQPPRD